MRKCVSTDIEKRLSKDKFGGESKYKGRKAGGGGRRCKKLFDRTKKNEE